MLVLTRKVSETILVGEDIVITVIRIGPNSVRIGISAPPDVVIVRDDAGEMKPRPGFAGEGCG